MKPRSKDGIRKEIEGRLLARFYALNIKPISKRGSIEECAFLAGAASALNAAFPEEKDGEAVLSSMVPPMWVLYPMCGRSVVAELKKANFGGA